MYRGSALAQVEPVTIINQSINDISFISLARIGGTYQSVLIVVF